jgi:PAS domain S-box-containing protein
VPAVKIAHLVRRTRVVRWSAAYLALGVVAAIIQPDSGQGAWYPALAIGVAMLLTFGWRVAPLILLIELAVSFVMYDFDFGGALVSMVVTTAEALAIVAVLRRFQFRRTLERADDVVMMGLVAAGVCLVGATIGGTALGVLDLAPNGFRSQWEVWVIGDTSGVVLTLPALLLVATQPRVAGRLLAGSRSHAWNLVMAITSLSILAGYFSAENPHSFSVHQSGLLLLALLPTFWVAIRFGLTRMSLYVVAMTVVSVIAYAGLGPHLVHSSAEPPSGIDMVSMMLPLLAVGFAALGVSAAIDAQRLSLERERAVLDASPLAIVTLDTSGEVLTWNTAAEQILGFNTDQPPGRVPWLPLSDRPDHPDQGPDAPLHSPSPQRLAFTRPDGSTVITRMYTSPTHDRDGAVNGMLLLLSDITAQDSLEQRQALLSTAIDQAGESVVVTDTAPAILYANPSAQRSSGYTLDELLGKNPNVLKSGLHPAAFYEDMWATLLAGTTWHGVMVNRRKNGEFYEEDANIAPVHNPDGELVAFVAVKRDLARERALEADVRRSRHDRATIQAIIERVKPRESVTSTAAALCAAIVDATEFDGATLLLLQADGSLIPAAAAGHAFDGEGAGDTIVLPDEGAAAMVTLTARSPWVHDWSDPAVARVSWLDRFASKGITATGHTAARWEGNLFGILIVATTAADGAAMMKPHLGLLGELGTFAGVVVGSQVEANRTREELRIEFRELIEQRRFRPAFQPYVELASGEVRGYEALTRFDDGTPPDRKIHQAWLVGMGPALEAALARAALEAAARELPGATISLNFSPETILHGIAASIVRNAVGPIVIEVTEHTAIDNYAALRAALRACGDIKVSIDDAGAGFASLRHILELEPDVVKLDIGLIRGIDTDLARQALTAGMSHYARSTNTLLVAEGVETAGEAETVRRLGVHYAQGFYFGRPRILD